MTDFFPGSKKWVAARRGTGRKLGTNVDGTPVDVTSEAYIRSLPSSKRSQARARAAAIKAQRAQQAQTAQEQEVQRKVNLQVLQNINRLRVSLRAQGIRSKVGSRGEVIFKDKQGRTQTVFVGEKGTTAEFIETGKASARFDPRAARDIQLRSRLEDFPTEFEEKAEYPYGRRSQRVSISELKREQEAKRFKDIRQGEITAAPEKAGPQRRGEALLGALSAFVSRGEARSGEELIDRTITPRKEEARMARLEFEKTTQIRAEEFSDFAKFFRQQQRLGELDTTTRIANIGAVIGTLGIGALETGVTTFTRPKETVKGVVKLVTDPIGTGMELGAALEREPLRVSGGLGGGLLSFKLAQLGIVKGARFTKGFGARQTFKVMDKRVASDLDFIPPKDVASVSFGKPMTDTFAKMFRSGKVVGVKKIGTVVELSVKKGGLPVIERTGAIAPEVQLQLFPKQVELLPKPSKLSSRFIDNSLQTTFAGGGVPKRFIGKITFAKFTESGKLVSSIGPETQTTLSLFTARTGRGLDFALGRAETLGINIDIAKLPTGGRPSLGAAIGKMFGSKRAGLRGSVKLESEFKGVDLFDKFDVGRSTFELPKSSLSRTFAFPKARTSARLGAGLRGIALSASLSSVISARGRERSKRATGALIIPKIGAAIDTSTRSVTMPKIAQAQRTAQAQRQRQRQRLVQIAMPSFGDFGGFRGIRGTTRPPPPDIPRVTTTSFSLPGTRVRRKKKKGARFTPGGRRFKYTSTLEAAVFNVRGARPKKLTGLELRPLRL